MFATDVATANYHSRHAGLRTSVLGRTGLTISAAGFGCYRVADGVPVHHAALRAAILNGVNLIDTSTNYADGASELLVGRVIAELVAERAVDRRELVVVTKVGYIQGSNLQMVRERAEAGSGFPEVVEYGAGLWHSIAPEFLHDQITRSLERLAMPSVDGVLLHNPEYYLNWATAGGIPLDEARAEYYRRIRDAFAHLEQEVENGRIAWYGISSNSFPHGAGAVDFTSLAECVRIAEMLSLLHHFAVIQFPANLVERGFITERNGPDDRTLMDVAREKNLGVLINRPLNAIVGNGLVRLADFGSAEAAPTEAEREEHVARIDAEAEELTASEREFAAQYLPTFAGDTEAHEALAEYVAVGAVVLEHWRTFGTIERANDLRSQYFAPRLNAVAAYLRENGAANAAAWFAEYADRARALLEMVAGHYASRAQERSGRIRAALVDALGLADTPPDRAGASLSSLAVRALMGVDGVDCVLVGMRRVEYVDDIIGALRAGPMGDEAALAGATIEA